MTRDGWCIECLEDFRYDDCGGYNPPCACGLHCRSCHDAIEARADSDWNADDYDIDDEPVPPSESGR